MSDEKWVTLTPDQVEALEQGVIVRAHRGADTMVQGPLTGLVGEHGPDVWIDEIRVKSPDWIEVRERDVPKPDPQRLVSVRADDLEALVMAWTMDGPLTPRTEQRIRAALRGETS